MKKGIISMLLASVMIFTLCSCQSENGNNTTKLGYEIGDTGGLKVPFGKGETIKFVGLNETSSTATYIFEKLSEITGLDVQVITYPVSSYAEKIKVTVASKNLPEIIGNGVGLIYELNDLASQGAFTPVNEYLDKMPNFKRIFGEGSDYNWIFKSYAAADGNLYALPCYDYQRDVNHGMLYRKDIFDKYNIPLWNSPETFYESLKALKNADPNCIPFTSKNKENLINALSISWGINGFCPYFDEETKTWKYSDTDPAMKDLLDFLKKLYDEKLLDPEFLTLTQPEWTKRMTSNKSYVTYDWIGRLDMFTAQSEIPEYDLRYTYPIGPKQTVITLSKVVDIMACVAKGKYEEQSMKLLDFLYSDAGAELMTLGIKGETYEMGKDGMAKYLEFPEDKKVEITDLQEKYGMFMQGTYKRMDRRSCYFNFSEREKEAQDFVKSRDMFEPEDPILAFSGEDQKKINDYHTKLVAAFKEVAFDYIVGGKGGDELWNSWLEKAKSLGVDDYIKIYNDTYKKMNF